MNRKQITAVTAIVASALIAGMLFAAEDRFTVRSPNGIAFSEFKGYEAWQLIAPSQPDNAGGCGSSPAPGCIKAILGNPAMIKAYDDGFPANGKSVPDGAVMAKVEWAKHSVKAPPYALTAPGKLQEVSFMVKDSKRFPATDGWGYATFKHDATSGEWKAFGDGPDFATKCHACHTIVKARDFVFTEFSQR
jgi:hypothetical protein